jgi:hypothetical protein
VTRRGGSADGLLETKNPIFFNGLESFDAAVDCAAANNGLKRRRLDRGQSEFRFAPGLAFKSESGAFSWREAMSFPREENALPPRGNKRCEELGKR